MEEGDTESTQSSSKTARMSSVAEGSSNVQLLHEKVNKFLKTGKFELGSPVTNEEINEIAKELKRPVDVLDKDYKEFLNVYGSVHVSGFDIIGPTKPEHIADKVKYMSTIQRGFESRCKMTKMKAKHAESCWLIGMGQGDEYYFSLSEIKGINKGNIYSMSHDGKSKIFATNFLNFLDKFFEASEREAEEAAYEEVAYEEGAYDEESSMEESCEEEA